MICFTWIMSLMLIHQRHTVHGHRGQDFSIEVIQMWELINSASCCSCTVRSRGHMIGTYCRCCEISKDWRGSDKRKPSCWEGHRMNAIAAQQWKLSLRYIYKSVAARITFYSSHDVHFCKKSHTQIVSIQRNQPAEIPNHRATVAMTECIRTAEFSLSFGSNLILVSGRNTRQKVLPP